MTASLDFIIPALLGLSSGMLGPIVIEKWRSVKSENNKLTSIDNDILNLQGSLLRLTSDLEKRMSSTEEKVRALEINLSHNTGVLKGKSPDIPLEDTTANVQASFTDEQ